MDIDVGELKARRKQLAAEIKKIDRALGRSNQEPVMPEKADRDPAVPIEASVADDHLICLEDGKRVRYLKAYVRKQFDMSPEGYLYRWDLPSDYPMTAPRAARAHAARMRGRKAS